jgi:hypothetical protein
LYGETEDADGDGEEEGNFGLSGGNDVEKGESEVNEEPSSGPDESTVAFDGKRTIKYKILCD